MTTNKPYQGPEKLVLCFDIGTTSSAMTITHLAPQAVPTPRTVNYWPESPHESKIPSLVVYDRVGRVVACGAEALTPSMKARVVKEKLSVAKWFKLHLHPTNITIGAPATLVGRDGASNPTTIVPDFEVPKLPPRVTIEQVYSSFLSYLVKNAREWYIANTECDGAKIWDKLIGSAQLVMAIPDGWDESEQNILKESLVKAKLLKKVDEDRVDFLREAEAAVHFALAKSPADCSWLKPGAVFTVADLGGSRIDVCMYRCEAISPTLKLSEVKVSDCVQAGGVFVDRAAEAFIEAKLAGSKFAIDETVAKLVELFESKTKRLYAGTNPSYIIKFGEATDTDRSVGISAGRLTLSNTDVESTFAFCTNEVLASIQQQTRFGSTQTTHLILTGGFGESPYLCYRLRSALVASGITLVTTNEESKKAVAEGLALWSVSQAVNSRAVRCTYGIMCSTKSNARFEASVGRAAAIWPDGILRVQGEFCPIVRKGDVMPVSTSRSHSFNRQPTDPAQLGTFTETGLVYEGDNRAPFWYESRAGIMVPGFSRRCEIRADLSALISSLVRYKCNTTWTKATRRDIASGQSYWNLDFEVCLFLAATTLKAKITWKENGVQREGPATVVQFDSIDRRSGAQDRRRAPADIMEGRNS